MGMIILDWILDWKWLHGTIDVIRSIGDFFVLVWRDEERWWLIGFFVFLLFGLLVGICRIYDYVTAGSSSSITSASYKTSHVSARSSGNYLQVTIKGIYRMNGPKPFTREIICSSSEVGYYSQLMGNKSKQAQWISTNFPGTDTSRGFSMTVNIK